VNYVEVVAVTLHQDRRMQTAATSTGLAPRTAATLAYAAWWITGVIFWVLERDDRYVRFHAAQAITAFGAIAALIGLLGMLAGASLSFVPSAFVPLLLAAAATWVLGVALWLAVMWKAASGDVFRIPLAAQWADKLNAES
jgi:uncharacterized membrane protein